MKPIALKEFVESGFLQEANRLFFHPRGLALEVVKMDDGGYAIGAIQDHRDDPEGVLFFESGDVDQYSARCAKQATVESSKLRHAEARHRQGCDIDGVQPVV